VFSWGAEAVLRPRLRISPRTVKQGLLPKELPLPRNISDIAAGASHSFAVHKSGRVYSWGSNDYAQTGIARSAEDETPMTAKPTTIRSLQSYGRIKQLDGGNFNSIAVTEDGKCLTWGRIDNFATGINVQKIPLEDAILDTRDRKKILTRPTRIPGIEVSFAAAGGEHCIAVTKDGKAYSWGFSMGGRTGQGTDDDIECATLIDNKAIRGQKIVWAGAGGTYSILASKAT
jgi:regulator of chromosome condensation